MGSKPKPNLPFYQPVSTTRETNIKSEAYYLGVHCNCLIHQKYKTIVAVSDKIIFKDLFKSGESTEPSLTPLTFDNILSTPGIRPNASGAATVSPDGKQD